MNTLRLLFALLVASAIGCSKSQETLGPDDRELVPVYAELLVLREQYESPASLLDSVTYRQKADSVLLAVGMSREEFSAKVSELALSQKVFQEFQTKVRMYLDSTKTKPRF
ncbi:MAG TPA: hypothetical protein DEP53_02550 [Bacteroidetes bacterium]|nr:hypothetical protein [Bacteroidota bacterium]